MAGAACRTGSFTIMLLHHMTNTRSLSYNKCWQHLLAGYSEVPTGQVLVVSCGTPACCCWQAANFKATLPACILLAKSGAHGHTHQWALLL
jgi:hypothetical protein